jgi:transcriptional regulator with XRE-family HTH domain
MVDVGRNIREAREARGLTVQEVSRRAGLTHSTLAWIEDGTTRDPKISTVLGLARALGVEPAELLREREPVPLGRASAGAEATPPGFAEYSRDLLNRWVLRAVRTGEVSVEEGLAMLTDPTRGPSSRELIMEAFEKMDFGEFLRWRAEQPLELLERVEELLKGEEVDWHRLALVRHEARDRRERIRVAEREAAEVGPEERG